VHDCSLGQTLDVCSQLIIFKNNYDKQGLQCLLIQIRFSPCIYRTPQESHGTLDDQASSSSVQAYIAERIGLENAAIATKSDQINQLDEELQAFQLMMEQKRKLLQ